MFFAETPLSYNDGNWHHMATVRDGTQMRIIIDGYIAVSVNNSAITNINNSTSLRIGSSSCNGFVGQLDETRLWSSARSQCNIYNNRLYEYSATPTALLLNCHYNQGVANATNTSVTTLTDFSDYNYIGTLIGFNLSGTTSNWVDDGCNAQGNTSAPAIGTTTATGCNNYTWNGTTYTSSGMYTSTFNAANGCDSISTLDLIIGKPVSGGNDTGCLGTILKPKATTLINPVQDQSNVTYNAIANGSSPWQSFTPGINGTIRYFEAEIRTPLSGMAATVFVELYEGQGTGGTLLGTSTVKTISSTSTYAFESFDFSAQGIYLESGQLYTARLVTSSFNQAWFRLSTTNPYPNGLLNNNASQDLKFKTTMCEIKWYTAATGGTLVPNPSTASLGSTTFYAEAYDGISCYSNRTPVTLTIEAPLVGSNTSAAAVCSGGSVILTGTGAHSYT
ncbi:MAG: hypothetical protein IPN26_02135 [Bacteroidetes bacterium]|nr:hypothetical protein [Bacteroidota bacterium]